MTRTTLPLLLFVLCLSSLVGCASSHRDGLYPPVRNNPDNERIFFAAYESHTGIIVNREHAAPWLPALTDEYTDARYLEFGWGDLDWYRTDNRTSGMALGALFVPTESGLWVWALPGEPEKFFKKQYITELTLSKQGFINLVSFINGSFDLDESQRPQAMKIGSSQGARYSIYRARGEYHAFKTCNHWTAEAMRQAGFTTGFWEGYSSDAFLQKVATEQAKFQSVTGAAP